MNFEHLLIAKEIFKTSKIISYDPIIVDFFYLDRHSVLTINHIEDIF